MKTDAARPHQPSGYGNLRKGSISFTMRLQQLLSYTRKAVDEYTMIEEGDHIAVGISGGKDSLTLLYAMHGLRRFYPKSFRLSAVTVDLGYSECDFTPVTDRKSVV